MPGAKRKQACIGEGAGRPARALVDDVLRAVIRSNDHSKKNIERILALHRNPCQLRNIQQRLKSMKDSPALIKHLNDKEAQQQEEVRVQLSREQTRRLARRGGRIVLSVQRSSPSPTGTPPARPPAARTPPRRHLCV